MGAMVVAGRPGKFGEGRTVLWRRCTRGGRMNEFKMMGMYSSNHVCLIWTSFGAYQHSTGETGKETCARNQ